MGSKIKILFIIFICFFIKFDITHAGYNDDTENGGGTSGMTNCTSGACWVPGQYGVRVSLYVFDADKKTETPTEKIGKTIDFVTNYGMIFDVNGNKLPVPFYHSASVKNRIEIIDNYKKDITFNENLTDSSNVKQFNLGSFSYDSPGNLSTQFEKFVMGSCYDKEMDDYDTKKEYMEKTKACLSNFFAKMGASDEFSKLFEEIVEEDEKDIFILYEPLALITIQLNEDSRKYIYVTGTELAYIIDKRLDKKQCIKNVYAGTVYCYYDAAGIEGLVYSRKEGKNIIGNNFASIAYQSKYRIAGFNPIDLNNVVLDKGDHNKLSSGISLWKKDLRYGVSIGIATLTEVLNIDDLSCTVNNGKYYGLSGTEVTEEQYNKECNMTEIEEKTCKFDLISQIVTNCKEGTQGYVKDIEDWDCIYSSRTSTNSSVNNHFYTGKENRYCSIYCREEITYSYPNSNLVVRAGNHFSVGATGATASLFPVSMIGTSECRISHGTGGGEIGQINHELFVKDWTDANAEVKKAWYQVNVQMAYSDSIKNAARSTEKNCAYYCDDNVHGIECCKTATRDWNACLKGSECANTCKAGWKNGKWDECATGSKCENTCVGGYGAYYCVEKDTPYDHGYTYTPSKEYYDGVEYQARSWCSDCGGGDNCSVTTNLSSVITKYNQALNKRNEYLSELMKCNNFQRTYKVFNPEIQFMYNEGEYEKLKYNYSYSGFLAKNVSISAHTDYYDGFPITGRFTGSHTWDTSGYEEATNDIVYDYYADNLVSSNTAFSSYYVSYGQKQKTYKYPYKDSSTKNDKKVYGSSQTIKGYVCNTYRSDCAEEDITYPNNDSLRMWTTKKYDYSLGYGVYNYINKDTGESEHTKPDKNYYEVGYGNLPTHYSRKTRSDYHFYLDFSSEIFGRKQKFYDFLKNGKNTGVTYGADAIHIYEKIWNNETLKDMVADCCSGGKHLNHSFVPAINNAGITTEEFLNTPCAKKYNCTLSGSNIICSSDNKYSSCNSKNYEGLRKCMSDEITNSIGKTQFKSTDYTYTCTYTIKNEIVCPPDTSCKYIGLSAVYRTIDLNNPFPNREPTGNWDTTMEGLYIRNNRGVNANEIYSKKDPLYEITLTPSLISRIRNYNRSHDMADYNLECNSSGNECKSNFIRKTYRSYFSGCGISGKGTSKCNAGEAW